MLIVELKGTISTLKIDWWSKKTNINNENLIVEIIREILTLKNWLMNWEEQC
jgi:hypothetical protein